MKHYEDYIARLHQIPRVLSQTTEVLRAGMKDKLMPVRFLLEKVPGQCEGIVDSDPFLLPTKKYPANISPEGSAMYPASKVRAAFIGYAATFQLLTSQAVSRHHRFVIALRSPNGRLETGLPMSPSEKRTTKLAWRLKR